MKESPLCIAFIGVDEGKGKWIIVDFSIHRLYVDIMQNNIKT